MTTAAITGANSASAPAAQNNQKFGMAALGQGDFLKLMTEQLKMQDPFEPTDNKEMLAQMAQFSSLAGISEMGETLKTIASKLDAVLSAQATAVTTAVSAVTGTATATATDTTTPTA